MDDYRDSEVFKRLVRQGLRGGSVGAENPHGMKAPASSREALSGEVVADARGGLTHRPTAGGEPADPGMGKGRTVNAPAKFTGLHIVSDNSRNWRTHAPRVSPLGVRQFLVLVIGGKR